MASNETRPRWDVRVEELYAALDEELAPHQDLCRLRGLCCDFRSAEHRLFATEVEVRYLLARRGAGAATDPRLCPFWRDGLCHAHRDRPLGCRTYFCDPAWRLRGEEIHARYHEALQRIHDEEGVPYSYRSWVKRLGEEVESTPAP